MSQIPSIIYLNSGTPAPPSGYVNVKPQADSNNPENVSFYLPLAQGSGINFSIAAGILTISASAAGGGVNAQTGNYTAVAGDSGKLISFNSGSAVALLLPSSPPSATWWIAVQDIGAGVLTVNRNSLDIDGAASNVTVNQNQGLLIFTDGTNYFTMRGLGSGGGSGTVTSVALTVPSWLTVSGSPITTSGTLAITGTSESGNEFLASPNGSAGAMTPRAIVPADLPVATTSALGVVKPDGITVDVSAGLISVPTATSSSLGIVQPDNSSIVISGGVLSLSGGVGGGGALTRLSQTILASPAATITFSSIPSGYTDLILVVQCKSSTTSGTSTRLQIRMNGDSANDYFLVYINSNGSVASGTNISGDESSINLGWPNSASSNFDSRQAGAAEFVFPYYANTSWWKHVLSPWFGYATIASPFAFIGAPVAAQWKATSAISSIVLTFSDASNFTVPSIFTLYGRQ
jgi:hypothetical protein